MDSGTPMKKIIYDIGGGFIKTVKACKSVDHLVALFQLKK